MAKIKKDIDILAVVCIGLGAMFACNQLFFPTTPIEQLENTLLCIAFLFLGLLHITYTDIMKKIEENK